MLKKTLIIIGLLLLTAACAKKDYQFNVSNDLLIIDQVKDDFSLDMLEDSITLTYGDEQQPFDEVDYEGIVDLETIGTYPITLTSTYKGQVASTDVTISVIDRKKPILHIFESELLVHIDEDIEINSKNFLINLTDGINGQISDRIKGVGDYDLSTVGTYAIQLVGSDESGNEVAEDVTIRVTDIIDEKALYLYKKSVTVAKGEAFVFKNEDDKAEVLNLYDALSVFSPTHRNQMLWFAGLNGEYKPKQSGFQLSESNGDYYVDYSKFEELLGYKNTNLKLQQEVGNYRHYVAESTYQANGDEEIKLTKFSIRKIDGVWLVDEFYLQY